MPTLTGSVARGASPVSAEDFPAKNDEIFSSVISVSNTDTISSGQKLISSRFCSIRRVAGAMVGDGQGQVEVGRENDRGWEVGGSRRLRHPQRHARTSTLNCTHLDTPALLHTTHTFDTQASCISLVSETTSARALARRCSKVRFQSGGHGSYVGRDIDLCKASSVKSWQAVTSGSHTMSKPSFARLADCSPEMQ